MFAPMRAFPRSPSVGFALGLIFPLRKLFQKFRDTIRNRLRKIVIRTQVLSDHPLSLTNGRSFFGLGNTRSWRTVSSHGTHSTAFSSQCIQGKPVRLCHGSKNLKLNRPTEQRTEQSSAAWLRVFRSEGASRAAHRSTRFEPVRFRGQTGSRPAPYQTKIPRPSPISLRYRFAEKPAAVICPKVPCRVGPFLKSACHKM
jgi:hypothetical protein